MMKHVFIYYQSDSSKLFSNILPFQNTHKGCPRSSEEKFILFDLTYNKSDSFKFFTAICTSVVLINLKVSSLYLFTKDENV